MDTPLEDVPLLNSFVRGDDAYRNSRFKLIPYISKGSWIVKQNVGKKACLLGQGLEVRYFGGTNYLEAFCYLLSGIALTSFPSHMLHRVMVATAFIVLSNVFLVSFRHHQSPVYTPEQLTEKFSNLVFLLYCLTSVLIVSVSTSTGKGKLMSHLPGTSLHPIGVQCCHFPTPLFLVL